jgi:tetratricopeptide (TPR) repeat protein
MSQTPFMQQSRRQTAVRAMREHLLKEEDEKVLDLAQSLGPKLRADPEVLFLRASALERKGRYNDAIEAARRSVRAHERHEPMLVLARSYRNLGETDHALRWCDRALEKLPGNEIVQALKAGTLEEAGRFDDATALLTPIMESYERAGKPLPPALRMEWSKLLVQSKRYEEAVELIDETVATPGLPERAINIQLHLKAKACDRKKDFAGAWEAAERANEIGRLEFDPDLYEQQVDALIENWSRERMERFPASHCDSELPVFVAGMPRSGTSLIDQIIDAHPRAAGVGELGTIEKFAIKLGLAYDADKEPPDCFGSLQEARWTKAARDYVREIKKLAPPEAERVVNKALGNNKLVGLIARLFPSTKIIHAIRDPRDVSISCFMGGFNNRLHPWTTRVEWAARAWEQSMRMMEHWKHTLDIPILDVHYERLVADPETEMPRIIEFLGLEWDDACREFYKSRRTVRTLSYDQVNRPLYTSSSGRHKNYAGLLEGVDFPPYDPFAERIV